MSFTWRSQSFCYRIANLVCVGGWPQSQIWAPIIITLLKLDVWRSILLLDEAFLFLSFCWWLPNIYVGIVCMFVCRKNHGRSRVEKLVFFLVSLSQIFVQNGLPMKRLRFKMWSLFDFGSFLHSPKPIAQLMLKLF